MLAVIKSTARRDWLAGFALSAAFHGALFFGGWALFRSARYGIETGSGGLEVFLVAALPKPVSAESSVESRKPLSDPLPADPESGEMVLTEPAQTAPAPVRTPAFSGDGSSPVPGKDPTSFYSEGGGQSDAEPGPFRNPAPPYPWAARRLGQEGGVVLRIAISEMGRPTRVEIQHSSGYPLLDESALTTVRCWKFVPARVAGVPRDSVSSLRVSFRLKENNEE